MSARYRDFYLMPRSWLGWVGTIVVGLILLAVAAVFVTAALIAGFVIAAVVLVRAWWLTRKFRRRRSCEYLSAEYTVEVEAPRAMPRRPPERDVEDLEAPAATPEPLRRAARGTPRDRA